MRIFTESSVRLANELAEKKPNMRLQFLQTKLIAQDIAKLDEKAFALAQKKLRGSSGQHDSLQEQAKVLRQLYDDIMHKCEELSIDWKKLYGRILSEVNLDINYVVGEDKKMSMRMWQLYRSTVHPVE